MADRKRYAIVGTGGRARMYVRALVERFRDHCELVGLCDVSQVRMDWHNRQITECGHPPVPTYHADHFDRMIAEARPEAVIVTTVDGHHHEYIIRAMDCGCDAITEKPMTIDEVKVRGIFEAIERTGRKLRVTFNYRYTPSVTKAKELIMDGAVGTPLMVDFSWMLDTRHGADYFRRWHREKDKSGGMLIHKASHHFDLVNWWVASVPARVFCLGGLKFYGKANAEARGEHYTYDRYTGTAEAADDPFAIDLRDNPNTRGLYYEAEADSGYVRDRNVFGEPIDIEDTLALTCRYRNGVILSYALIAYSPWEGFRVSITGDRGRLELYERHGSHLIAGQSDEELAAAQAAGQTQQLVHFPMFKTPREIEIPEAEGRHGGSDPIMLEQAFSPQPSADRYHRAASHVDGAAAVLMGIAGNHSMATGQPIDVDELYRLP